MNVIPRIPIASEVVGLLAVLLAPGLALEPCLHGDRWTFVERLGVAAAFSLALAGLLGVGLHLVGLPVSPTNILALLLLVAAIGGAGSFRFRRRPTARRAPRAMRPDIVVGLGSLGLVVISFLLILVLHPGPERPALEAVALDVAGRLVAMPIRSEAGGVNLTVGVRSASGATRLASVIVAGDGINPWSAVNIAIGPDWTSLEVPIRTPRTGRVVGHVRVTGGGSELTLPIAMDVAR